MKRFFVMAAVATLLVGCAPVKHVPIIVNVAELSAPPPTFPFQAIHLQQQGTAVLLVLVGKDGSPKDIKVFQSSGFPYSRQRSH